VTNNSDHENNQPPTGIFSAGWCAPSDFLGDLFRKPTPEEIRQDALRRQRRRHTFNVAYTVWQTKAHLAPHKIVKAITKAVLAEQATWPKEACSCPKPSPEKPAS
jgi:hypothetical protein